MNRIKLLSITFCMATSLSSCYNSHNAEYIIGKWSGTSVETCGTASKLAAMQLEFTSDNKYTAKVTPTGGKPEVSSGRYIIERYRLVLLNQHKEEDAQKIENLSAEAYEGSVTAGGCKGITKLRKMDI